MKRQLLVLVSLGLLCAPVSRAAGMEADAPDKEKKDEAKAAEKTPGFKEEVTVESASKAETTIVDAPATMSVVTGQQLATSPAQNYADLLRTVPGMNVIQTSARDLNLTTRQATSTLNNSQLVLVDGRSVYLDFFGLVLWDFVPNPASGDIKQIEVVRGPASVVWGANALSGVINVITKIAARQPGLRGVAGRRVLQPQGRLARRRRQRLTSTTATSRTPTPSTTRGRTSLTAGYYKSDPYSRPVGSIALDCHPYGVTPCRDASGKALPGGFPVGGAPYPADQNGLGSWENNGTSQPKVTLRFDQELKDNGGRITYEGGYAGTAGIIHTGIGPFDIQSDSYMAYGKAVYRRGPSHRDLRQLRRRERAEPLLTDPATGKADRARLQDPDLRRRGRATRT